MYYVHLHILKILMICWIRRTECKLKSVCFLFFFLFFILIRSKFVRYTHNSLKLSSEHLMLCVCWTCKTNSFFFVSSKCRVCTVSYFKQKKTSNIWKCTRFRKVDEGKCIFFLFSFYILNTETNKKRYQYIRLFFYCQHFIIRCV